MHAWQELDLRRPCARSFGDVFPSCVGKRRCSPSRAEANEEGKGPTNSLSLQKTKGIA